MGSTSLIIRRPYYRIRSQFTAANNTAWRVTRGAQSLPTLVTRQPYPRNRKRERERDIDRKTETEESKRISFFIVRLLSTQTFSLSRSYFIRVDYVPRLSLLLATTRIPRFKP